MYYDSNLMAGTLRRLVMFVGDLGSAKPPPLVGVTGAGVMSPAQNPGVVAAVMDGVCKPLQDARRIVLTGVGAAADTTAASRAINALSSSWHPLACFQATTN